MCCIVCKMKACFSMYSNVRVCCSRKRVCDGAGRRRTEGLGPAVLRPARTHAQGAVEAGTAAGVAAEVRLGERCQRPGGRGHGGAHGHPPGHRLRHRGRHTAPGE